MSHVWGATTTLPLSAARPGRASIYWSAKPQRMDLSLGLADSDAPRLLVYSIAPLAILIALWLHRRPTTAGPALARSDGRWR